MSPSEIEAIVMQLIADRWPTPKLDRATKLFGGADQPGLYLDSLDLVDLTASIEEALEIELAPTVELESVETVGEFIVVITSQAGVAEASADEKQ